MEWIDIARGIGIVLVVYGHALRSLYPTTPPHTGWPVWQDTLIYSFHMPLFFVLSGLFIGRGLARGRGPFIQNKLLTVAYPYFLWSLISGVTEVLADQWVNTPLSLSDIARIPIQPIEQYWFLYALFVDQMIICALFTRRRLLIGVTLLGVVAVMAFGAGDIFTRSLGSLPYVVLGMLGGGALGRAAEWPVRRLAAMALAAWATFALYHLAGPTGLAGALAHYGGALAGTLGTVALAMLIGRAGLGRMLKLLGQASMAIYVMHTLASAGLRILLMHGLHLREPMTLLVLSTIIGLLAPLLVCRFAQRHGLATLLGLDRGARHAQAPAAIPATS
ncbi:acyltransferase family protein [Sphingomonas quercus]|uniref:Acyltransferase family protein n=1 Tax=Sphingomonas quercus TaxID=2842451 RepID=A0ABS6BI36_9SPHN|nr:acyltransferase family protein [Sphingomonas quercus]